MSCQREKFLIIDAYEAHNACMNDQINSCLMHVKLIIHEHSDLTYEHIQNIYSFRFSDNI